MAIGPFLSISWDKVAKPFAHGQLFLRSNRFSDFYQQWCDRRESPRANGNPNDPKRGNAGSSSAGWKIWNPEEKTHDYRDLGSAARFFYSAKADGGDRLSSKHPTVKPVDLIAYLCRLITPPKGTILDPFAGSGTTGMACLREGFDCILIEREAEYVADIERRVAHVSGTDSPLFAAAK